MVGSLGNLYESIQNLSETYMQPNQNKNSLLNPRASLSATGVPELLAYDVAGKVYMCPSYHRNVADDPRTVCPQCKVTMSNEVPIVGPEKGESSGEGGFVRGVVTYMVMDDLSVNPMSTISRITLLNMFNVKEVDRCTSGESCSFGNE